MAILNLRVGNGAAAPCTRAVQFYVEKIWESNLNPAGVADSVEVIDIPKNTLIALVRWEILTVEGAAETFTIGDTASAVQFIPATSSNALAEGINLIAQQKYYSNADVIRVVPSAAATALRMKITACGISFAGT